MKTYAIVGAGGFGREVIHQAKQMLGMAEPDAYKLVFVDDSMPGETVNGFPVMTSREFLDLKGERLFALAISDAETRKELAVAYAQAGAEPFHVQALSSIVEESSTLGAGAILCPFTIVTANATIGESFHANIYAYVAHDCVIGDFVTFAPGVKCNGNVHVEDHAYIGTGAIIKQGRPGKPLVIGKGAIVGMGAVVTKSVAPGATVVGNPAKPLTRKGLGS